MKNHISVNAKYSKASNASNIANHNDRTYDVDYLLDEKDIEYPNFEQISTSTNSENVGGAIALDEDSSLGGIGTYASNLQKLKSTKSSSSSSANVSANQFINKFNSLQEQKTNILRKKYNYKPNAKENTVVEMVVGLSEEMAQHYLDDRRYDDINNAYVALSQAIKDKYGFEPIAVQTHFDEGFKGKNNYHSHLTFFNFDFEKEKTVLKFMKKKDWENIQDLAQNVFQNHGLDFKRGISKDETKKKHLKRNDFIIEKQELVIATYEKELKNLYTEQGKVKNDIKEERKLHEKGSVEYKKLTINFKAMQKMEKESRLKSKLLKEKLKMTEEEVENLYKWKKGMKEDFKTFLHEHLEKKDGKYIVKNVNDLYTDLINVAEDLSNVNIKSIELEKSKAKISFLEAQLRTKKDLESAYQNLNTLNKELVSKNKNLEMNYINSEAALAASESEAKFLKEFIEKEELEKKLEDFLKNDLSKNAEFSAF